MMTVMENVKEFAAGIAERLNEAPEVENAEGKYIVKMNGQGYQSVTVKLRDDGGIVPCIDAGPLFQAVQDGLMDMDGAAWNVLQEAIRKKKALTENTLLDDAIKDKDFIRKNVTYKVMNKELNKEYLADKLWIGYLDLALVYIIDLGSCFPDAPDRRGSIAVTKAMLDGAGLTEDEVAEAARDNLSDEQAEFMPISSMLGGTGLGVPPMWVLTNKDRMNGARMFLREDVMDQVISQTGEQKVVLIPSSIHEFIVIPETDYMGHEELCRMIQEVNSDGTCVHPTDILGDHPYIYDGDTKCFSFL